MSDLISLLDGATIKVSSTLDKSVGKKYLTDKNVETCWTSQQGLPQYIQANFKDTKINPVRLSFTFQGGFVGTRCVVQAQSGPSGWETFTEVFPEDVNRQQVFDLPTIEGSRWADGMNAIKLTFEQSSDFFGRITVYDLTLEGHFIAA
ncbi:hypothetical protein FA13DRAFT_1848568 [Coprinellus micaceus]|uniref:Galactose-binding like protein n=1 Tax=Coprinellus micaceus TaxID=71717 RepID=A0A4Y7TYX5_COPMI|nr:hypothetical protein FA13DRAFT_1848568 [Coprinellus micaceus]